MRIFWVVDFFNLDYALGNRRVTQKVLNDVGGGHFFLISLRSLRLRVKSSHAKSLRTRKEEKEILDILLRSPGLSYLERCGEKSFRFNIFVLDSTIQIA